MSIPKWLIKTLRREPMLAPRNPDLTTSMRSGTAPASESVAHHASAPLPFPDFSIGNQNQWCASDVGRGTGIPRVGVTNERSFRSWASPHAP